MASVPRVWSKFSVTKDSGTVNFIITDPPQGSTEEIRELSFNYFAMEETFTKASGMVKSAEAIQEYKEFSKSIGQLFRTQVCCLDNGNGETGKIIAASFTSLINKSNKEEIMEFAMKLKSKEMTKLMELVMTASSYDMFAEQNIEQYYDGRGLVVHPDYRGYGVARELLKIRQVICEEEGVPLTSALMTAYGSQKAAERAGWETIFELNLKEFGDQHEVTFEDSPLTAKIMVARARK